MHHANNHSDNSNIDLDSLGIKGKTDLVDISSSPFKPLVTEDEIAELQALASPARRATAVMDEPEFPYVFF
jgi:hypothetical protein